MSEIWKPVPGFHPYEASSLGRIRNTRTGRVLLPGVGANGYRRVSLWVNGVRRMSTVHHLVAVTFHGPRQDGMLCRHLDGDKLNNSAANISWGTPSQNRQDMRAHGTYQVGELSTNRRLTEDSVRAMRRLHASGVGYKRLGVRFGVHWATVANVCKRRTWAHVA